MNPALPGMPEMRAAFEAWRDAQRNGYSAEEAWQAGFAAGRAEASKDAWISVEERLPELEAVVLGVSHGGTLGVYSRVDDGEGWLWYRQTWQWNLADASGFDCDDDYQLTHWMPLPKAPPAATPTKEHP